MRRRSIFFVVLGLLASFFIPHVVHAEEINRIDETITVQSDGRLEVSEGIIYDFANVSRHGIFRTIPVIKTNTEGKKFVVGFSRFSVVDDKGSAYEFKTTRTDESVSLKIGDPDRTMTGVHPYFINYLVEGGLTYFSDHDELYWNVTGNDWEIPIDKVSVVVALPGEVNPKDITVTCFTGAYGSTDKDCTSSVAGGVIKITTTKVLAAGEGLTVAVMFPKNIVAVLEPKPYVPFWETLTGKILLVVIIIAAFFWYGVLPIYIPIHWWRHGRDPKAPMGVATAWFDPPKTKDGRSLTPGETGTLVDEKADMQDITATIVDLARRGYIRILEPKKGEFSLEKITKTVKGEALRMHEETLMDGIFKSGDLINLKTENFADTVAKAKGNLYDAVVAAEFFVKNPQTTRTIYGVLAAFALASGNFPLVLSALIFGLNMPAKTILGVAQANVGKSLKNFLTSQERQLTFQAKNQMFFEKLLPFAIAFGVEKIWADRFRDIAMKPPDWYSGYSSAHFNSVFFVNSLRSTGTSFARAATPTSSSSGFSSGGGGFSGGGGGGGGGGSW
jgi:uncharacterized membrane protein